eukprot:3708311-Pleurochrysis_carterae.AAC.1
MRSSILKLSLVSRSWYAAIAENWMHITQLAFKELTLLLHSVPSYALLPSVADGLAFLDVTWSVAHDAPGETCLRRQRVQGATLMNNDKYTQMHTNACIKTKPVAAKLLAIRNSS